LSCLAPVPFLWLPSFLGLQWGDGPALANLAPIDVIIAADVCYHGLPPFHILADGIFCTGISLLAEYFVLDNLKGDWNILTDGIFCTGISLLTEYLVLDIITGGIFCTGISLLTEYFVLEYPY
jgi:hypothetical protein